MKVKDTEQPASQADQFCVCSHTAGHSVDRPLTYSDGRGHTEIKTDRKSAVQYHYSSLMCEYDFTSLKTVKLKCKTIFLLIKIFCTKPYCQNRKME